MSMNYTPTNNKINENKAKISFNSENPKYSITSNNRRVESAKLGYRPKSHIVFRKVQTKTFNDFSQNSNTLNSVENHSSPIKRPIWKYSYYVDKNDMLNINNDPEFKKILNNYKDFGNKTKPITYSWTKPRMVKIIENNKKIEEEIKSSFWKYSYLFQNDWIKPPGRLLKLMVNQLTSGYGNEYSYMKNSTNGLSMNDNRNIKNKLFHEKPWRHPGIYRYIKNEYEPIKIKREN